MTTLDDIRATIRRLTNALAADHEKGDPGWPIVAELGKAYDALKEAQEGDRTMTPDAVRRRADR